MTNALNLELRRKLAETAIQLGIHREYYYRECNARLQYELENRSLKKRVVELEAQVQKLMKVLS